jgi:MarR family transcriptional regulator, temperature-dependent positive regulator of motility
MLEHMKAADAQLHSETDYALLRQLAEKQDTNQRALAGRLNISVGKLNFCLQAVIARGWVKVSNFKRADNKWAYAYLLTPAGASAKVQLTKAFLERKEREFESLQREINELRSEIRQDLKDQ